MNFFKQIDNFFLGNQGKPIGRSKNYPIGLEGTPSGIPEITLKKAITNIKETVIRNSNDSYKVLTAIDGYISSPVEKMYVLYLNRRNKVLAIQELSKGGITATVADPRVVFSTALKMLATSIIISHNHPSGNLNPSSEDMKLTRDFKEAGKLLQINLLDHIIVADDSFYSFADMGDI